MIKSKHIIDSITTKEPFTMMKPEKLDLVSEWDKTFPKSKSVNHKKSLLSIATASPLPLICIHLKTFRRDFPPLQSVDLLVR